ncbi:MAG: hypothetical protein RL216_2005 [Pseudomonadota bacterium]
MTGPFSLPRPDGPDPAVLSAYLAVTRVAGPLGRMILRRRLAAGKEDPARWHEKLGHPSLPRPDGRLIWLHAVSVGEGLSVLPLLRALVAARADVTVLLTCTTVTAAALLRDRVPQRVLLQFLPLDLAGPVARFLDHWRPDVAVMVESEFWPRLIHDTHARGIPLVLANARISDRSAARWARQKGLARALLGRFSVLTAPDAAMAARLQGIGADPARLRVTGTLKRAAERLPVDGAELARLRAALGGRAVWCAASTHPGEEAVVAATRVDGALCILAPRHPARGDEVEALLRAAGLSVTRRSRGEVPGGDVHLADTLGEMGLWFDLCPVTLVAGSLVDGIGGHNAYEPALHGSAILHGPHVGNFANLYARLDAAGAARVVRAPKDLADAVAALLRDAEARQGMVAAAGAVLAEEGDGVAQVAGLILGQMPN